MPGSPRRRNGRGTAGDDSAGLLVVRTRGDGTLDRLRAGETTSAVLLAATGIGLATTPLSQALEIESARMHVQRDVLGVPEHPRLVIRVGWLASAARDTAPRAPLGAHALSAPPAQSSRGRPATPEPANPLRR